MNNNIKEKIEYPSEGILSKNILKNEEIDITLFCMAAGKEISEHTSTKSGTVYVVEGKGVFNLEGKEIVMEPGVLIYLPANAIHFLKAGEKTSFILTLFN
jgi:quercetin dioxygenase-like cupin family protein